MLDGGFTTSLFKLILGIVLLSSFALLVEVVPTIVREQQLKVESTLQPLSALQLQGKDVYIREGCTTCHTQETWRPYGQIEMHNRTRFPLTGAHVSLACQRCHPGARVGKFVPTDPECLTCHRADLAGTTNPPHIPLGWTDKCDRCHIPTRWEQASPPD
jgi:hypothetical protein